MNDTYDIGSSDRLSFTLFLAAALHALVIFGITFKIDRGTKIAPTLNITLATHKSQISPDKADFLAQHNQQASGSADSVKELTTKELSELNDTRVRDISPPPQTRASRPSRAENTIITTLQNENRQIQVNKVTEENETREEVKGEDEQDIAVNPEFASLKAKLDRLTQEYANRPRIRRLTSVSTKFSADAQYLNTWAQKVESVGNENFPEAALRDEIFGRLRLLVTILPNGAVHEIAILQSSGHNILDNAAVQIVELSSPFQPFPPEIRKDTDRLEIIRTWSFQITGLVTE